MKEWFSENAMTLIMFLFGTSGWLGLVYKNHIEDKKERDRRIKELEDQNRVLKEQLDLDKRIEKAEENIDKSTGSIYYEKLPNENRRAICGFCWEREHIKIPIAPESEYNRYTGENEYLATCEVCRKHCTYSEPFIPDYGEIDDENQGELPF